MPLPAFLPLDACNWREATQGKHRPHGLAQLAPIALSWLWRLEKERFLRHGQSSATVLEVRKELTVSALCHTTVIHSQQIATSNSLDQLFHTRLIRERLACVIWVMALTLQVTHTTVCRMRWGDFAELWKAGGQGRRLNATVSA